MKCVIVDDERPAIRVIKRYIERIPNLQLVGTATNPITGIEIIKKEEPDVVFLDIQMGAMSGIDVMRVIADYAKVVFCTAFQEFAVQSYELAAVDYLMKPIEFPRFALAVQRVEEILSARRIPYEAIPNDYIFVKTGQKGKMVRIDLDEIDYIEALGNYMAFHIPPRKILAEFSMKELEARLPENQFMRIHKSFIVSLRQVASLESNEVVLEKSGKHIPIGRSYRETFLEKMKDKLLIIGQALILENIVSFY